MLKQSARHLAFIGAGMITHDQNLPAGLEFVRAGHFGTVHLAATGSASIRKLLFADRIRVNYPEFPPDWFKTYPTLETPEDARSDVYYKSMLDVLPEGSVVIIGIPDALHYDVIMECIERRLHVVTVKSLCVTYEQALLIRKAAFAVGVFVGIDFHKMADYHAQTVRLRWQQGHFGKFRGGEARLIEDHTYFAEGTPFAKHLTYETSDPATYVLCHYLQLLEWITGERPTTCSVRGVRDTFPGTGVECYSWAGSVFGFQNESAVFVGLNGLQHPKQHFTRNNQGMTFWGTGEGGVGTFLMHADDRRGMDYAFDPAALPRGARVVDGGTDYIGWIPRLGGGPGFEMIGYGCRSFHNLVMTALSVERLYASIARRARLNEIDEQYLVATPGNTGWLALVYEAMRVSILNSGKLVEIDYALGSVGIA